MAFGFFKDKSKGPLAVTCPLCEHTQQESPLAVSSYCKGCKAYLSFQKGGEVTARAQATPDPFAHRPPQPKVEIEYKAREESLPSPAVKKAAETSLKKEEPNEPALKAEPERTTPPLKSAPQTEQIKPQETVATPQPEPKPEPKPELEPELKKAPEPTPEPASTPAPEEQKTNLSPPAELKSTPTSAPNPESDEEENIPRYHRQQDEEEEASPAASKKKAANERLATCFECGDSHLANALANSTQCRKCGRLISMKDQHIKESWSGRIQTRGDVYIHKKGIALSPTIQCHNLIVEGDFTGNAECSGDLTLRRHGKIAGTVVCDRLLVERRAKIEFLHTVATNECKIDGLVTGDIDCRGRLALEKRSTLTGNVRVGTLTVADGAKHTGQIQMGSF